MEKKLKILFLPRWYPDRFDPMPGLFIQRQAEALVQQCEIAVLSVHPVKDQDSRYEIDVAWENGVFAVRVFYHLPSGSGRLRSIRRFFLANFKGLRLLRTFRPDLVHVQVLTREGIIAWLLKLRRRIPYVISEHWSRYFPENDSYKGLLRKILTKTVVRSSEAVIVVSDKLRKSMEEKGLKHPGYFTVPNIVDETRFVTSGNPAQPATRRLVHVSCFEDKSKNITGFLNSLKMVLEKRKDFVCYLIGDGPDLEKCKSAALMMGLKDYVVFPGMMKDNDLIAEINTADFLVLSSRYETFGTVIVEALTCGIPVVTTDVGIASEVISSENGIIIPPGDDERMASAILQMLKDCRQYDRDRIRSGVLGKFSEPTVANQLLEIYNKVLEK